MAPKTIPPPFLHRQRRRCHSKRFPCLWRCRLDRKSEGPCACAMLRCHRFHCCCCCCCCPGWRSWRPEELPERAAQLAEQVPQGGGCVLARGGWHRSLRKYDGTTTPVAGRDPRPPPTGRRLAPSTSLLPLPLCRPRQILWRWSSTPGMGLPLQLDLQLQLHLPRPLQSPLAAELLQNPAAVVVLAAVHLTLAQPGGVAVCDRRPRTRLE